MLVETCVVVWGVGFFFLGFFGGDRKVSFGCIEEHNSISKHIEFQSRPDGDDDVFQKRG